MNCERTVCGTSGAPYIHLDTGKRYCPPCAHKINAWNPGLCVLEEALALAQMEAATRELLMGG